MDAKTEKALSGAEPSLMYKMTDYGGRARGIWEGIASLLDRENSQKQHQMIEDRLGTYQNNGSSVLGPNAQDGAAVLAEKQLQKESPWLFLSDPKTAIGSAGRY